MFRLYARSLLVVAIASAAVAMPIVFFGGDLVELWTRSLAAVKAAAPSAAVLASANLLGVLHGVPYNVAIGSGRTRIPLVLIAALLGPVLVGTYLAVHAFGPIGAAWVWFAANVFLTVFYFAWVRGWAFGRVKIARVWMRSLVAILISVVVFWLARPISGDSALESVLLAASASLIFLGVIYRINSPFLATGSLSGPGERA